MKPGKILEIRISITISGEFVTEEYASENPDTTVAVTEAVKSAQDAHDGYVDALFREQGDSEC